MSELLPSPPIRAGAIADIAPHRTELGCASRMFGNTALPARAAGLSQARCHAVTKVSFRPEIAREINGLRVPRALASSVDVPIFRDLCPTRPSEHRGAFSPVLRTFFNAASPSLFRIHLSPRDQCADPLDRLPWSLANDARSFIRSIWFFNFSVCLGATT